MVKPAQKLGSGVYTVAEAARLVRMNQATARSWFAEADSPVLTSDYSRRDGDFAVSFLDLMDTHAVKRLRASQVPMAIIRRSYVQLAKELGTRHPFAHSGLYTDGRRVLVDLSKREGHETLRDAIDGQGFFYEMRAGLERVHYDQDTGLASNWGAYTDVLLDPQVAFGKPAVEGTATHTFVIYRQYLANDKLVPLVADLYDLSETQVEHAVEFEESLLESTSR